MAPGSFNVYPMTVLVCKKKGWDFGKTCFQKVELPTKSYQSAAAFLQNIVLKVGKSNISILFWGQQICSFKILHFDKRKPHHIFAVRFLCRAQRWPCCLPQSWLWFSQSPRHSQTWDPGNGRYIWNANISHWDGIHVENIRKCSFMQWHGSRPMYRAALMKKRQRELLLIAMFCIVTSHMNWKNVNWRQRYCVFEIHASVIHQSLEVVNPCQIWTLSRCHWLPFKVIVNRTV